jgi:hypothetical protein
MSHKHKIYIAIEFKDYKVTAPGVRQIWGSATLLNTDVPISDIVIICRGFTREAKSVADQLKRRHGVNLMFKVDENVDDSQPRE